MTRSGSANKKLPLCDYFAELSFLRDVVTGRKTESNIQVIQPVDTATTATPDDPSTSSVAPLYSDIEDKSTQPSSSVIRDTRAIRNARKRSPIKSMSCWRSVLHKILKLKRLQMKCRRIKAKTKMYFFVQAW